MRRPRFTRRDLTFLTIGVGLASLAWPIEAHAQGFGVAASGATAGVATVAMGNSGNIASVSKWLTDLLHIGWGGNPDRHPPLWILIALPVALGVGLTMLFCVASGIDLTQMPVLVESFLAGLFTGGGGAGVLTATHNQAQTGNPTLQVPSTYQNVVPSIPDPDASAVQVPLTTPSNGVPTPSNDPPTTSDPVSPDPSPRQRILAAAASYDGVPYVWGGEKPSGVDCSGYTRLVYRDAGLPIPDGVRTAEQQRQFCTPIGWQDVQAGDLLFFEHTYEPDEDPGPDGHVASHIGISLGRGTQKMWNAVGERVQLTDISGEYWQGKLLSAGRHPGLVDAAPPARAAAGLTRGIDVASYQPTDLADMIRKAEASHVVVRMYQRTIEGPSLQEHSRQQVESARASGCSVGAYLWLYANVPTSRQVNEALDLAASCGLTPKVIWLDIEPYTDDTLPSAVEIRAALAACEARGIRGGIYSAGWVWERLGYPSFPGVPLWMAAYDHRPEMNLAPLGDMVLMGKQYDDRLPNGEPLDVDIFDASVV